MTNNIGTKQRVRRADRHTWCVVALVATHYRKFACDVGEGPSLYVLDPCSIDPQRHVMFALACDGACVAANAVVAVEHKAQSCHNLHATTVVLSALEAKAH